MLAWVICLMAGTSLVLTVLAIVNLIRLTHAESKRRQEARDA